MKTPVTFSEMLEAGPFRCSDFARAAGITRQAALRHIRRAVTAGVLAIHGLGRGTRYVRGCCWENPDGDERPAYAPPRGHFWSALEMESKSLVAYVNLHDLIGPTCKQRRQLERVLDPFRFKHRFIVIDLRGVQSMSAVFRDALAWYTIISEPNIAWINATPTLQFALERAVREVAHRPSSASI